ncbi:arabinosyltransferase domain-containing protein [Millisia brevis]|uniref:arabinosyltransferase domain-containing protein n=1 Tax=Millisia brevis TaxID=264148 RepID=UPI00082D7291|nr:arabinosyltransferase domain-containing protein [Millisia brevis]
MLDTDVAPPAATRGPIPPERRTGTARLIAIIAGIAGLLLIVSVPFLPVRMDEPTVSWPEGGTLQSVNMPLVGYAPLSIDVSIPCSAVVDSAQGTTLFTTAPVGGPNAQRYGMIVRTEGAQTDPDTGELLDPGSLQVLVRDNLILSTPLSDLNPGCSLRVTSNDQATTATVSGAGVDITQTLDEDKRPQIVGLFTQLTGPTPAGFGVTVDLDARFTSSPSLLKLVAMLLGAASVVIALGALHVLDRRDSRSDRRTFPPGWWRPTRYDVIVVGTLGLWHIIGANTADDGYLLGMARTADQAGYMSNYFRWWGVTEAPFGAPYYDLLRVMTQVSTASVWMRLPALLLGIICWWVISREVLPRLGARVRREPVVLWTSGLVFLSFWLVFNNGLRPEPVVAVGVLLTWASMERSIATRRLLPAAIAVLVAGVTLNASPLGLICFAPLIAGAKPVIQEIVRRRGGVGILASVLPILAAGSVPLLLAFADQPLASLPAMQHAHSVGPDVDWWNEYIRYQYLMMDSPDGSLTRKFAVFAMFLSVGVSLLVLLRKGGRIPGTSLGPPRRLIGTVMGAPLLMMFAPTKWTHHFGVYAGIGGAIAGLAAAALAVTIARGSRRNRALFAAAVLFLLTICFHSRNGWWYVSVFGVPWWDKPPSISGFRGATVLMALTILALLLAAYWHVREPYLKKGTPMRRVWNIPPLPVAAGLIVLFAVASLAKGMVSQYPAYSVGRSNIDALMGNSCGLANDVLVEPNPTDDMLTPLNGNVVGTFAANNVGFDPNGVARDLTPDENAEAATGTANTVDTDDAGNQRATVGTTSGEGSTGINGSSVALPYGLDPLRTPVLGTYTTGVTDTATLTTGWYLLPADYDLVTAAVAGRIRSIDSDGLVTPGTSLEFEFGRNTGSSVESLGTVLPIDIGPRPAWRNVRVPAASVPAGANVVRIVAEDSNVDPDYWLAVTPPRIPQTVTLNELVGSTQPVLLDWAVGLNFPCQRPFGHHDGIAEVPAYRVLPDRPGARSTNAWQDHFGGGPLGWTDMLLRVDTMSTFLKDDWHRDWGDLQRFTPIDPTAANSIEPRVDVVDRWGWYTPGPIVIDY